ncbi:MAG: hypothetical protein J6Q94_08825 [Clostridia bacterium]|nr:hypothetical protein [Clostridia bacterium]
MIEKLEYWFSKCSDCLLHPEYEKLLNELCDYELNQEIIDFLCNKATSKKHWCELRFEHLKILLLNETALNYDLKQFYFDALKRCRRLWLKMFYIRGYAFYATEEELEPIMKNFQKLLEKNHDYIDYEPILSVAGLPYLVDKYGFDCFKDALRTAKNEYQKINPRLRKYFTMNEKLEQTFKLSPEEAKKQFNEILKNAKI